MCIPSRRPPVCLRRSRGQRAAREVGRTTCPPDLPPGRRGENVSKPRGEPHAQHLMATPDPYPPIGDYALIGDCHSAALVSRSGSIDWCCLPRFDSGSTFARLLDWTRGGHCSIAPKRGDWECEREYLPDTLVLATTFHGPEGRFRMLDCFTVPPNSEPSSQRQILRVIEGQRGSVEVEVRVAVRFDYGEVRPWIRRHGSRLHSAIGGNDGLEVWFEGELAEDAEADLVGTVSVGA